MIGQRQIARDADIGIVTIPVINTTVDATTRGTGQYFTDVEKIDVVEIGLNVISVTTSIRMEVQGEDDLSSFATMKFPASPVYDSDLADAVGSWIFRNPGDLPLHTFVAPANTTRRTAEKGLAIKCGIEKDGNGAAIGWVKLRVHRSKER
jgi:hypothetical protein